MGRTLVIGDVHGAYKALEQIFERAAITTNDKIIFLGDYVDGWSQSVAVIDFLIDLKSKYNCVFMLGNHDELLLDWLKTGIGNELWLMHGGKITAEEYSAITDEKLECHIQFLESLEDYHLDDNNKLFLHAGFTNLKGVTKEHFSKMFYWDRTLWETALVTDDSLDKNDITYPKRLKLYNEIFIGHTAVTLINETTPVNKACVWNIDTGAAFKGPLTVIDADTKEFWQSDPVYRLYPDEKGRN
ncbi:MAG: serine/threonine protein phosphatase [Flavobacterium sp. MedPE-SWcel]|uniref:metallophosphoesterase family protein n=1 Tax=uncultured Flavobacterium sp. TaxID=165435 RepID=UPI0009175BA2|nr:metallophosphoesterase family protein [uncultured Flavobacterium sp.]OIQ19368.1 MAG: serine/threonine protein phosphatase [Flavobacterium sp. MedPE-SWcel]